MVNMLKESGAKRPPGTAPRRASILTGGAAGRGEAARGGRRWENPRKIGCKRITRWWQLKYFIFSPRKLGKIPILTQIFQMG